MIKIQIVRTEKNPDYKKPRDGSEILRQSYDISEYSKYEVLDVEITEEQFEKIRKAVLEVF